MGTYRRSYVVAPAKFREHKQHELICGEMTTG